MGFSTADRHIIINYHYIEEPREDRRGIYPCAPAEFERQLDFVSRRFRFGGVEDVFAAARSDGRTPVAALTFDDCLRSQFENAVPILIRRGIPATFFPITSTFAGLLPPAHKIHFLRSSFSGEELVKLFNTFLATLDGARDVSTWRIPLDRRLPGQERPHKAEDVPTANFKEMLLAVPEEVKEIFFRSVFAKLGVNEEQVRREFFMSPLEVCELSRRGFTIGNHSHTHLSYRNDDQMFLSQDLAMAGRLLEELVGVRPNVFSYPHGRYNHAMVASLKAQGFRYAVTIENRAVGPTDAPFAIPRLDTNALKPYA